SIALASTRACSAQTNRQALPGQPCCTRSAGNHFDAFRAGRQSVGATQWRECEMTLGSHQRTVGLSQNHITPKWIIDAIGPFKLDPCAADPRPWDCAQITWATHGLERPWPRECFIYLNPPFDRYEVGDWIARLAEHGNGITLLHARTEAEWFEPIWQRAAAILFMADR